MDAFIYGGIMKELAKHYEPKLVEAEKYDKWKEFDPAYRFDNSVK